MIYFSLFHIETEVTLAGLLGWGPGGGAKGIFPLSKIIGGMALLSPSPYAYAIFTFFVVVMMLHLQIFILHILIKQRL